MSPSLHLLHLSGVFSPQPRWTEKMSHSVSFGQVTVYEFSLAVGNNPSTSAGIPVCLHQLKRKLDQVTVDDFEASRSPKRSAVDLKMSSEQRFTALRSEGHHWIELHQAAKAAERSRLVLGTGIPKGSHRHRRPSPPPSPMKVLKKFMESRMRSPSEISV